jgi:hypothetical protein
MWGLLHIWLGLFEPDQIQSTFMVLLESACKCKIRSSAKYINYLFDVLLWASQARSPKLV